MGTLSLSNTRLTIGIVVLSFSTVCYKIFVTQLDVSSSKTNATVVGGSPLSRALDGIHVHSD